MVYEMPIRILFTSDELERQNLFKESSGMTFNSLTDKAISFYIDNQLMGREKNNRTRKEKRIFRERKISASVYEKLTRFCEEKGKTLSDVTAQAISVYIDLYNI